MSQTVLGILISSSGKVERTRLTINDFHEHAEIESETLMKDGTTQKASFSEIKPLNEDLSMVYQWEGHGGEAWAPNISGSWVEKSLSVVPSVLSLHDLDSYIWGDVVVVGSKMSHGVVQYLDVSYEQEKEIRLLVYGTDASLD